MSFIKRFWWIGLLLLAAIPGGWFWWVGHAEEAADRYATAAVERGPLEETVSAIGAIQPREFVDVGTQVTGQLKTLHVQVGDAVTRGQLVAEIDPTLLQSKVDSTKATLRNLRAQLADRVAQARLADQQFKRNKALLRDRAASEEAVQQSEAAAESARAQVEALRAQIDQTQSTLEGDEANLRYTKIHAPISGTVVSLAARQGQTLVSSQTAPVILRIADLNTMTIWAQVSEADVPKVQVGMPAYFNTLGQPERRWVGAVRQILPTPETVNNVILYNVLFDAANPDGALKPQMSAQVYFQLARVDDALIVPAAALQSAAKAKKPKEADSGKSDNGGKEEKHENKTASAEVEAKPKTKDYVVRVLRNGAAEERTVTIGLRTRVSAQVVSGLAEGEQVIVGSIADKDKGKNSARGVVGAGRRM